MNLEERMMKKALALAQRGRGLVSPNPMVGAVITKRGIVIAQGYHHRFGGQHAEIDALRKIGFDGEGCTLYVNLEPCCHFGKTPPCVHAIIKSGIKNVVIGMEDPNPIVAGKGIAMLKNSGINIETGILEDECRELNEQYIKYIKTKRPFVVMKVAMTLDGKIALASGSSRWITSEEARSYVHELRNTVDAVLVGARTVNVDNPSLNVRSARKFAKHPLRVVLDSVLETRLSSRAYDKKIGGGTIVFTTQRATAKRKRAFEKHGVEICVIKGKSEYVNINEVLKELGTRNIASILVEGGKEIFTSFFKKNIVDKLVLIFGNKIVGGEKSVSSFGPIGVSKLNQAFTLNRLSVIKLAQDVIISGYLK